MQKPEVTIDDVFMYVSDIALEEHKFVSVKDIARALAVCSGGKVLVFISYSSIPSR